MQFPWTAKHQSRLDILIDQLHDDLEAEKDKESDKAKAISHMLKDMYAVKNECDKSGIDPNTVLTVSVYAALVLLILVFELSGHSITLKQALALLPFKPSIKTH